MEIPEFIREWETSEGVAFFRSIGVREGFRVLDFGFGHGHFAVAAAGAVGAGGRVLALDCNEGSAEALADRVREEGLGNITVVKTDGCLATGLEDRSVDCMLLYDILHMQALDRTALLVEARRVLKAGGILSVLPFHMAPDEIALLAQEIGRAGFAAPGLLADAGPHFGMLYTHYEQNPGAKMGDAGKGTVYNFARI